MNEQQTMTAILERLPTVSTLKLLASMRRQGMSWDELEDRMLELTEEISEAGFPFSSEAEKYQRRVLSAAYAIETRCN